MIVANPPHSSQRAFELVLDVIVNLMMPLFMGGTTCNSDPNLARIAAIEMLDCFRPRDSWEVLTGAQISGFGLAALGSIGLSMQPDLPLPMSLRLRSSANSLHRSGNQARKALDAYRVAYPDAGVEETTPQMEAALADAVHQARHLSAEAEASLRAPVPPPPQPTEPAPDRAHAEPATAAQTDMPSRYAAAPGATTAVGDVVTSIQPARTAVHHEAMSDAQRRKHAIWALGVAQTAQDMAAAMADLPPSPHVEQQMKIAALSTSAQHLVAGIAQAQMVAPAMSRPIGSDRAGRPAA